MPALKFPGGAFLLMAALFFFPARDEVLFSVALIAEKKKYLSFDIGRNRPASLLIAMDSFDRNPKEVC